LITTVLRKHPKTKVSHMAGLSSLADKAREMFHKRGGTEAAKQDLEELKDIQAGEGSLSDKAKAAADALKDPGTQGPDRSASPDRPDAPEPSPGREQR
jgi:hypothetical protein